MVDANVRFRMDEYHERCMSELLGFVKGVVADHRVSDGEAVGLKQWLDANPNVASTWPANVISDRLWRILEDGVIEDDERSELERLLRTTVGDDGDYVGPMVHATRLACDDPPPFIEFTGRVFVFTGQFLLGTRKHCERVLAEQGGLVAKAVTSKTDYLVVGTLASQAWVHSTHGRKVEDAVHLRSLGAPIKIVSEEHWSSSLC